MANIPLPNGSYIHPSQDENYSRCINYIPFSTGIQGGLNSQNPPANTLLITSGLKSIYNFTGVGCRYMNTFSDGNTYAVVDNSVYKFLINPNTLTISNLTTIGTLSTSTGFVYAAQNPFQVLFIDGSTHGYCYSFVTSGNVTPGTVGGSAGNTYTLTINGTPIYTNQNVSTALTVAAAVTQINTLSSTTGITAAAIGSTKMSLTAIDTRTITVVESGTGFVAGTNGITVTTDAGYFSTQGKFHTPLTAFRTLSSLDNFPTNIGSITFLNSYFLLGKNNTTLFYASQLNDGTTYDPLDVANKESSPDSITALGNSHGELWIFGGISAEVWTAVIPAPATGMPFSPLVGGVLKVGCPAPASLISINDNLIWLDSRGLISQSGVSTVLRDTNTGLMAQPVSDDATGALFQKYDYTQAISMTYIDKGHLMYQISFLGDKVTWVLDLMTALWHERTSFNTITDQQNQHIAQYCVQLDTKNFCVMSSSSAMLYRMSHDYKDDDGTSIIHTFITPPLDTRNKLQGIDHLYLRIGTADSYIYDGSNNPQIMMSYSTDGGHKWGNEMVRNIGTANGQYNKQIDWNRLGTAREWRFKCTQSDPIDYAILELSADFSEQEV